MINFNVENRPYAEALEAVGNKAWRKFGSHNGVGLFAYETVWGDTGNTDVDYLAANNAATIESTDANDDGSPAGSGARTAFVRYLDSDFAIHEETGIVLNGTTPVLIGGDADVYRILKVSVLTAGATGSNEGELLVKDSTTALTLARVPIGTNHDQGVFITVPADHTCVIHSVRQSSSATSAQQILIRENGSVWRVMDHNANWAGAAEGKLVPLLTAPAGADIEFKGNGGGGNTSWHGAVFAMLPDDGS